MQKNRRRLLTLLVVLGAACRSAPPPSASHAPPPGSATPVAEGREVLAVVKALSPKAYTDDLPGGEVMVSDVFTLSVVEPRELSGLTISAYYQQRPEVQGHVLTVGDFVRFELPSEPERAGILLWDLKGLRLAEAPTKP